MATATRELSAGPDRLLAGKREKQNTFSQMIEMDLFYLKNMSIWLDLKIMLKTGTAMAGQLFESRQAPHRSRPGGWKPSLTDDDFTNPSGISSKNMKRKIAVGVVGCGYWGPLLVRNFKSLPDCQLKAVCDVSAARLKHLGTLYPDVEGMSDPQQLLNGSNLDAVVIATPVKHHYSLAKASLLAGKHTFIEKPMASSSAECEELIEIAERNGLVLMVDHTFLYSAPVRKDCRNRSSRRSRARSATSIPGASTWAYSKRTSMSPGTWRRTTSRSFCISLANFPPRSTARETLMSRRGSRT